ncbi:MAG: hypothetical protein EAZ87_19945 [Nostocales cyanobacterium]|nr:MAG: hypothetical protein EAZ87_19945 [Nostocales cyanobacterium]
MSSTIPQIEIGNSPGTLFNVSLSFWLPPNTPFGNLQLKHHKIITRLDRVNERLQYIYEIHPQLLTPTLKINNEYVSYGYSIEELIFHLRRATDEIISMYYLLSNFERTGSYTNSIKIDSIGGLLHDQHTKENPPFDKYLTLLEQLNEVSNAFKHSFVNSDCNLIGKDEPCVYAFSLKKNKLSSDNNSGIQPYGLSLCYIVEEYNKFYIEINSWLKGFSERHRDGN